MNLPRPKKQRAEISFRRLESYLSSRGPDTFDEAGDESDDEEEEEVPEAEKKSTLEFFTYLKRQATSRHLVSVSLSSHHCFRQVATNLYEFLIFPQLMQSTEGEEAPHSVPPTVAVEGKIAEQN